MAPWPRGAAAAYMFKVSPWSPRFVGVPGLERKSALLCQLHDGLAIFAPATGGVQEPRFACVGREGPSASRAACSWGACEGGRLDRWLMR